MAAIIGVGAQSHYRLAQEREFYKYDFAPGYVQEMAVINELG